MASARSGRSLEVSQTRTRGSAASASCTGAIIAYSIDVRASSRMSRVSGSRCRDNFMSRRRSAFDRAARDRAGALMTVASGAAADSPAVPVRRPNRHAHEIPPLQPPLVARQRVKLPPARPEEPLEESQAQLTRKCVGVVAAQPRLAQPAASRAADRYR